VCVPYGSATWPNAACLRPYSIDTSYNVVSNGFWGSCAKRLPENKNLEYDLQYTDSGTTADIWLFVHAVGFCATI